MKNRLFCSPERHLRATRLKTALLAALVAAGTLGAAPRAVAGSDAPQWMHALVGTTLPTYDEKTDAVLLYSQTDVTVVSADKVKTHVREAYKILRPGGRGYGEVFVPFNAHSKVTSLHGWCIPAQGKDYEVKDKDAMEISLPKVAGSELVSDVKDKFVRIPAPEPGNIVGYEYEVEQQPLVLQSTWYFQEMAPVRESHFSLQLPPGWSYKSTWLNYPESKTQGTGANELQWSVSEVQGIRAEDDMPPFRGIAGQMIVSFFPAGGASGRGFTNWQEMGNWYHGLTSGRVDASPEIKQSVSSLTGTAADPLAKMQAIAKFVQHDIRYVAIELGIGGFQPHPAPEVFSHRYGDCKDKATLMSAMLSQIGIESYYVVINSERGSVTAEMPASAGAFDHAIIAIRLPKGMSSPALIATVEHPRLGTVLFFDPTNELIPFGQIGGYLQANYGLLVAPDGGELVRLPQQPTAMNSIRRTGKLTLEPTGVLKGEVKETRLGDRASAERWRQRTITKETDRIKPIESLLAASLSSFQITHATIENLEHTDQPFGFNYSFEAPNYAKNAGNLLLVRPRVLGNKSSPILETKDARKFAIEFDGPSRDTDAFEITIPAGYEVDDVPPAVDADYSFASYHSKTEVKGNVIGYTRTIEVKELSVPVARADELKKFYRIIAGDERNTVVLKAK